MFRKLALAFVVLLFLLLGFFGFIIKRSMDQNDHSYSDLTEAESYCVFKNGSLKRESGTVYCVHGEKKESVEMFFDRLGE